MVLAICLGVVLFVIWVVVVLLEKLKGVREKGREERKEKREDLGNDRLMPVIIAGIVAYEEGLSGKATKRRRVVYQGKEEKVSWWRTKGRLTQT